jgi:phage-related protein (TIGR01555 family)
LAEGAKIIGLFDRLSDFVTGLGGSRDRTVTQSFGQLILITATEIDSMYRSDWVSRKLIDIVPDDMVRNGRRWKAQKDQITKIENLEADLSVQLWPKVLEAMKRARLVGGCGIFIGVDGQSPQSELDLDSITEGSLKYLTLLRRSEMRYERIIRDPQSPYFRQPENWIVDGREGTTLNIHPSRVVLFTGPPSYSEIMNSSRESLLAGLGVGADDVWGDSLLQVAYDAVKNAASSQQHIAGLIPDARNDVVFIPNLGKILQNPVETGLLTKRFTYMRDVRSMFNLVLMEGNGVSGAGARGEEWKQRQVSFTQLPEVMNTFLEIVAAAGDIPITRFLGQSPGGLDSTGEADMRNYYDHVASKQKLVLGPALQRLDEVILRSALGSRPPEIFFEWAPLWSMTEQEKAEVLDKKASAARRLVGSSQDTPIVNALAMSEAIVNTLVEDGTLPGLEAAAGKNPLTEKDVAKPDPIELAKAQATARGAAANNNDVPPSKQAKKAATKDQDPLPTFVYRRLIDTRAIRAWATAQGIVDLVPADEMHVTIVSSKDPIDWLAMGEPYGSGTDGTLTVAAGGPRVVERLGLKATVLEFASTELQWRNYALTERGASSDFNTYIPHVTLSMSPQTVDLSQVKPYTGPLSFGPELFERRKEDA